MIVKCQPGILLPPIQTASILLTFWSGLAHKYFDLLAFWFYKFHGTKVKQYSQGMLLQINRYRITIVLGLMARIKPKING